MRNLMIILGIFLILWPSDGGVDIVKDFDELEAKAFSTVYVYAGGNVGPVPYDPEEEQQEEAPPVPGELGDEPDFIEEPPPVVVEDLTHTVDQDITFNSLPADVNVYVWSASWCPACQWYVPMVSGFFNSKNETRVFKLDYDKYKQAAAKYSITSLPTVQIVSTQLNEQNQPIKVWATLNNVNVPDKNTIVVLSNQGRYNATHFLTDKQLNVPRYIYRLEWGGWIDLDSYSMNCNCNMCQNIRYLQQRRANQTASRSSSELPDHQQPSTDAVISTSLLALNLGEEDLLGSLGCGDAPELIEAVAKFNCRGVGMELDEERAEEARRLVSLAGLSDRIKIYVGDARDFKLTGHKFGGKEYEVTAIYAYLYEGLLNELTDKIDGVDKAVTPYHRVKGLPAVKIVVDDSPKDFIWLYGSKATTRIDL